MLRKTLSPLFDTLKSRRANGRLKNTVDHHVEPSQGACLTGYLVDLREVHKSVYQPDSSILHILQGINLQVKAGEHIAIVGRSGTGKTTLLNILGLLDVPTGGSYTFLGRRATTLSEMKRAELRGASVGFVFQQFNLFEERTALENVAVPLLYSYGSSFWKRDQIAAEVLYRVGLANRLESLPGQLSGGEQQRVAIARALIRKPNLILADEPTGALDPETGEEVMRLLEEVARENNSALVVITHDKHIASRANTVYELYDGVLHLNGEVTKAPVSKQAIAAPMELSPTVEDELPLREVQIPEPIREPVVTAEPKLDQDLAVGPKFEQIVTPKPPYEPEFEQVVSAGSDYGQVITPEPPYESEITDLLHSTNEHYSSFSEEEFVDNARAEAEAQDEADRLTQALFTATSDTRATSPLYDQDVKWPSPSNTLKKVDNDEGRTW